jgi:hypothetical protein
VNGRFVAVVVFAVGLVGLAGCSNSTPGTGISVGSSTPAPSSPNQPGSGGSALSAVQPCGVLDSSQISQNGLTNQESTSGSGARSCKWSNDNFDNGNGYALKVDLRDAQGVATFNTAGYALTDDPIGHHQAKQAEQTSGSGCIVTIGVSSTSRVDVIVDTATDPNQACTIANQYAKLIEPKLP